MRLDHKYVIILCTLTLAQLLLVFTLPRLYAKKFTKEYVNSTIKVETNRKTYLNIAKRSVECSFIAERYFNCRGSYPEKNFKKVFKFVLYNQTFEEFFRYGIAISGYLAFASIIYEQSLMVANNLGKILLVGVLLFSNPSLGLMIFEPYTLLSFGLILWKFKARAISFASLFFGGVLSPLFALMLLSVETLISNRAVREKLINSFWVLLGAVVNVSLAGFPDSLSSNYFYISSNLIIILIAQLSWTDDIFTILKLLFLAQTTATLDYPVAYAMLIGWFILTQRMKQ